MVSLGGETVTVAATPTVDWVFGDGSTLADGGAGRTYAAGPPPADAVLHTYQTRCLPGDRGHNPDVLADCGNDGYDVGATVTWQFSYHASGPIDQSGTVPARSTQTGIAYPVSEARAFLVGGTQ